MLVLTIHWYAMLTHATTLTWHYIAHVRTYLSGLCIMTLCLFSGVYYVPLYTVHIVCWVAEVHWAWNEETTGWNAGVCGVCILQFARCPWQTVWRKMLVSNVLHNVHMSSFQFEVPVKYQRYIIGQRGQNLKRVESKTGVFNIRIVPGPTEVQCTPWQLHISVIWDITVNHASAHALADG